MKLDEKLVYLRKEKGLTQSELADMMDISRQAISRWEVGTAVPSIENLSCLSKLYGVSVDYLLNEGEEREVKEDESPKEEEGDSSGTVREGKRRTGIKWAAVALALLVLTVLIGLFIDSKDKETYVSIEDTTGEKVEPDMFFSLEW